MGPQVNFGVVVGIVGVVALDFFVVFVGPTTVVFTLRDTSCHAKASMLKALTVN